MEIHSGVAVDTALISRQSVISNQTAAMAQRREILHVLNTTGIVLASVILKAVLLLLQIKTDCPTKLKQNLVKAFMIAGEEIGQNEIVLGFR